MTKFSKIAEFLEWAESQGIGFQIKLYTRAGVPVSDKAPPIRQGAPGKREHEAQQAQRDNDGSNLTEGKWMKAKQGDGYNVSMPPGCEAGQVVKIVKRDGTGQKVKLTQDCGPAYGDNREWMWEKA